MVEVQTATEVSKISIQLSAAFAIIGIGLLYLAIVISDASETVKVLWASGLSLAVAFIFLVIWTMARDAIRVHDREQRRRSVP
jgi:membrane protein CcdC involved in cytochrome C biogenesis